MTVNELFKVWLHNRNPNSKIMVWNRELGEYIFDSDDFRNSNYSIKEIENTEVGCFHQYYDNKLNKEVLIINVDNIYKRVCKGGEE